VDESNRIVAIGDDGAQPVPGMEDQIDGRTSHGVR
jgi:aspartate 1-decarboxylase